MIRPFFFNFCFHILLVNVAMSLNCDSLPNSYGLLVLNQKAELAKEVKSSETNAMVDIQKIIPDIFIDIKYATTDNFTHVKLYPPIKTTFMRAPAVNALKKIQEELGKQGLCLKIWDAYRPYSITEKMWDLIKDDRYVADPKKGSGHNRGIAVDLTIIRIKDKSELDMGTGYDNFTDSAHQDYNNLSEMVLKNRALLRSTMLANGFKIFDTEWWHYFWGEGNFSALDFSFDELNKMAKINH